ncbi:hypothetical protein D3C80_1876430 [compost metagenome]
MLDLPAVQAKFSGAFIDPMPRGPQAFSKFTHEEMTRFRDVVKQTGVTQSS